MEIVSLDYKKALRKVNKVAREVNKSILNDDLWKGRFYMRQSFFSVHAYEDHSGLEGGAIYEFIDLKTGFTKEYVFRLIEFRDEFSWHIWRVMNDFIIEDCKVWEVEGRESLLKDKTVYRNSNALPNWKKV